MNPTPEQAHTTTALSRIDDTIAGTATACLCGCTRLLAGSPSDYWATEACQHRWFRARVGTPTPDQVFQALTVAVGNAFRELAAAFRELGEQLAPAIRNLQAAGLTPEDLTDPPAVCRCLCLTHRDPNPGVCVGDDQPLRPFLIPGPRQVVWMCPPCHAAQATRFRAILGRPPLNRITVTAHHSELSPLTHSRASGQQR